jgi:hypothetical protein
MNQVLEKILNLPIKSLLPEIKIINKWKIYKMMIFNSNNNNNNNSLLEIIVKLAVKINLKLVLLQLKKNQK